MFQLLFVAVIAVATLLSALTLRHVSRHARAGHARIALVQAARSMR